jgi:lipopolysaccharide transport system ATP-binding protein
MAPAVEKNISSFDSDMNEVIISVRNVSKKFCKNLRRSMAYGIVDLSKNLMGLRHDSAALRNDEFWALEDINFELRRGETLGIIGLNGSGKTTMLRLLAGIFPPDKGELIIKGRIGALIAVGAGFHPHMTGRENIFLNGAILGMSHEEIQNKFNDIINFAELSDFLDSPVSTYSTGMRVRLGFSIAIQSEIEILLVDEILAVGDIGFQLKCFNKIGEMREKGLSTIFISHNMHQISSFCNNSVVLEKGKIVFYGNVENGIHTFRNLFKGNSPVDGLIEKIATGNESLKIQRIDFSPSLENNQLEIQTGSNVDILISYEALKDYYDLEVDISLRLPIPYHADFFQASNRGKKNTININRGEGMLKVSILNINLNDIQASLYIALWESNRSKLILWWRNIPIKIKGNALMSGWCNFDVNYTNYQ